MTKSKRFAGRTARKCMHWASCTRSREHAVFLSRSRQKKFENTAGNKGRRTRYLQKHNSVALSCASARLEEEDLATLALFPPSRFRGHHRTDRTLPVRLPLEPKPPFLFRFPICGSLVLANFCFYFK